MNNLRLVKAEKIINLVRRVRPSTLELCADVGCSSGIITKSLSTICHQIIGLDVDYENITIAHHSNQHSNVNFVEGSGLSLPLPDNSLDLVISTQVYEHCGDPQALLEEIYRTLKPGGICFFSGPNRWWPFEFHYRWLFIHWLPTPVVDQICRERYHHPYDLQLLSFWQLKRLASPFHITDFTADVFYNGLDSPHPSALRRLLPLRFLRFLSPLFPNFNWILEKPTNENTH